MSDDPDPDPAVELTHRLNRELMAVTEPYVAGTMDHRRSVISSLAAVLVTNLEAMAKDKEAAAYMLDYYIARLSQISEDWKGKTDA